MTVKSKRGRRRYTAFSVPGEPVRATIESAVSDIPSVKVITCSGGMAVIRSSPERRVDLEDAMGSKLGATPVDCSGTLRALRARNPGLEKSKEKRRK